jgi:hypothetical protein
MAPASVDPAIPVLAEINLKIATAPVKKTAQGWNLAGEK